MYEICSNCSKDRAEGLFNSALTCYKCDGKGIVRKSETYICNNCGENLCLGHNDMKSPHGLVDASVTGGYCSDHLFDMTSYEFSLCEKCLRTMFNKFVIPPKVTDSDQDCSYAEDLAYFEYRTWRNSGGVLKKLKEGICSATIDCQNKALFRNFYSGYMTEDGLCEEHKDRQKAMNSYLIPYDEVSGIPFKVVDRTSEDRVKLANAFLKATARKSHLTYCTYLDECVADAVGCDGNVTSGIWVPSHLSTPLWLQNFVHQFKDSMQMTFPDGTLIIGPLKEIETISKAPEVKPFQIISSME